jgi:hypothetical protein
MLGGILDGVVVSYNAFNQTLDFWGFSQLQWRGYLFIEQTHYDLFVMLHP